MQADKSVDLHEKVKNSGGNQMEQNTDRRTEQRLRYYWPIWFAEDVDDTLLQGQMVDLSSRAAAFTCYAHDACPNEGQYLTVDFSVPHYGSEGSFDMASFTRSSYVNRVDNVNSFVRRIAVQFVKPLPFKPGEQENEEPETQRVLEPVAKGRCKTLAT